MRPGVDGVAVDDKRREMASSFPLAIEHGVDEDRVPEIRAIDNGSATNTDELASTEAKIHTSTLDVIASLYKCM